MCAYSGYFREREKLLESSSGGAAIVLSEIIIKQGGVVIGACYSSDFRSAEFACIDRVENLSRLKGSKYVETNKIIAPDKKLWPFIAEKLKTGQKVLFIGLGCDAAALKSFIRANNINDSNLYTIDLICYGPTLKEVHSQYIDSLTKKFNSRIKNFTVRYKKLGWTPMYIKADFEDGRTFCAEFYKSDYGRAFGTFSREVCYSCKFRGVNHRSDITIGDYWGLTPEMDGYNPDGVSIFIVNSERGQDLINMIDTNNFALMPADLDFIIEHNRMYYKTRSKPEDYKKFCDDLKSVGLHRAIINHEGGYMRFYAKKILNRAKKFIPSRVKKFIKRKILHK
ncbi:MAG: Coenzyme F420 hydrogenase/dehydrogenase, beta subunit C-terminal domain [Synergistaceae bacterium]|nr:Coenzyme F420 hydrogenase/dehydrogenase, beta subunit C-terminal domain [Synergistaceae bacterium]